MDSSRQHGMVQSGSHTEPVDYALFGIVIYLAIGVGQFLKRLLDFTLVDAQEATLYFHTVEDDVLYNSASSAFSVVDGGSGLILALAIGAFYYFTATSTDPPLKSAGIAASVGTLVILLVFMILMLVLAPDGTDISIGDEIPGLIASVVGAALTAVLTVTILERTQ